MILINKNTSNSVVLTLQEKYTITDPNFLWYWKNDMTQEVIIFQAPIIHTSIRYQEFTIIENATPDFNNGIVYLNPVGYWTYIIYELPTGSSSLDVDDALSILEQGKVLVLDGTVYPVNSQFDIDDNIVVPGFNI